MGVFSSAGGYHGHEHDLMEGPMNSVKASEFKAKCLNLMDRVAQTGEPLVITKNGKPVVTLVPYGEKRHTLAGLHAGAIRVRGDILAPLDEPWEAAR